MHTPPKRRPDALRVPRAALPLRANEDPDQKLKLLFGPVLGSSRVTRRDIHHGEEKLVTASADINTTSLLFPNGHPMQGEDRYEWFLAEPGPNGTYTPGLEFTGKPGEANRIKLGYAKPDPFVDSPEVQAQIAADYQQRLAEQLSDPIYHQTLLAKGVIDQQEYADRLQTLGYAVGAKGQPVPVAPKPVPPEVLAGQPVPPAESAAPETPPAG